MSELSSIMKEVVFVIKKVESITILSNQKAVDNLNSVAFIFN